MLGVNIRRLAEYNLRRELWERRIGWYLVFQLQNQASKTTSTTRTGKDGKTREIVKPQHPLLSQTILDGAGIDWQRTGNKDPGRVIRQFVTALDTLQADGIISQYQCLDGDPYGECLPVHGRLKTWLQWRWAFLPGTVQAGFLRPKREAAEKAKASAAARHDAAQRRREEKGQARGG